MLGVIPISERSAIRSAEAPSRLGDRGALARMLAPVPPDVFFAEHWESKPLVVRRCSDDHFADLLSLDDLDRVISEMDLGFPEIVMVNAERETKSSDYVHPNGSIDVPRVFGLFADGTSIIFNALNERLGTLSAFSSSLESELGHPIQTNVYLTPANAKAFKPHYDTHDVFIVQLANTKRWRLYGTPLVLPYAGQEFDPATVKELGPLSMEFELEAGDVAYIPRGLVHEAHSCDATSLHVTVGILAYTWTDLLIESVLAAGLDDPLFRRSLPPRFTVPGGDVQDGRATFDELLRRLATPRYFDDAVASSITTFTSTRRPRLRGQMTQILARSDLSSGAVVRARKNVIYRIAENYEGELLLEVYGNEIRFPRKAASAVRYALTQGPFVVDELPGELDAEGKLVLVRRLIREGLIAAE